MHTTTRKTLLLLGFLHGSLFQERKKKIKSTQGFRWRLGTACSPSRSASAHGADIMDTYTFVVLFIYLFFSWEEGKTSSVHTHIVRWRGSKPKEKDQWWSTTASSRLMGSSVSEKDPLGASSFTPPSHTKVCYIFRAVRESQSWFRLQLSTLNTSAIGNS